MLQQNVGDVAGSKKKLALHLGYIVVPDKMTFDALPMAQFIALWQVQHLKINLVH